MCDGPTRRGAPRVASAACGVAVGTLTRHPLPFTLVAAFRRHDPVAAVEITRAHVDALRREMFVALPSAPARP